VIGAFAEISRAVGVPLRFPGTDQAFGQLVQVTDARLLARASLWAATSDRAGGEAFNVTNGDVFRWERMWDDVARHLGMETASPVPLTLASHMADKAPLWRRWPSGMASPSLISDALSDGGLATSSSTPRRMSSPT